MGSPCTARTTPTLSAESVDRLITSGFREAIAKALQVVPPRIVERLRFVHFLTDTNPHWVGLHDFNETIDGRSYFNTAHCAYPWHTSDGSTTIVLPADERPAFQRDPSLVVHELGHALDFYLDFSVDAFPITDYAHVDRHEAFAEFFRGWLYWHGDQDILQSDEKSLAVLNSLC